MHARNDEQNERKDGLLMKLSLFTNPSSFTSFRQSVDFAVQNGLTAIEPSPTMELTEPDVEAARKIAAYAAEKGIRIACFSMGVNLLAGSYADTIAKLKRYIDVAAALGSPLFHHTLATGYDPTRAKVAFHDVLEHCVTAVRELYDYAEQRGVRCAYENQGFYINGGDRYEAFLAAVGRNVAVVADVGNILFVDETPETFIGRFAPLVAHVHVKDYFWKPAGGTDPGEQWHTTRGGNYLRDAIMGHGVVDFETIFRQLDAVGYDGCFSLEYCGYEEPVAANELSIRNLRRFYQNTVGASSNP